MVISNCEITKQDSKVLKSCVMQTNSDEYKQTKQFHTGVDLSGDKIYSAYSGTVVLVGQDESGRCVTIQTGSSFCVSYKHLSAVKVRAGQNVNKSDHIGDVNRYVHVELLQKQSSKWPVRINTETWYKQDPQPIFDNTLPVKNVATFNDMNILELSSVQSGSYDNVSEGQIKYILTNNEGE